MSKQMKKKLFAAWILLLFLISPLRSEVVNYVLFIGQRVANGVTGTPLTVDANGGLKSGLIAATSYNEITATANTTTSSSTDAVMNAMTFNAPATGTYLLFFNTDLATPTAGAVVTLSFYVAGVQDAESQRKCMPYDGGALSSSPERKIASLQGIVAATSGQAITVQWSTSSGTTTAASRSLIWWRLN